MSIPKLLLIMSLGYGCAAVADVWMWKDVSGESHYVETNKAIYMWQDESGKVFYSDAPEHVDAVAVRLIWVSKGTVKDMMKLAPSSAAAEPDESAELLAAREQAAAHDCQRVTEVYESYRNAPRLYRTNDAGEKEFLSKTDASATLRKTKAKMREFCK